MANNCQPGSEPEKLKIGSVFLECPVCSEIPRNHIYQCCEGHILCDSCYSVKRIEICPVCPESLNAKVRNRAMEAVIAALEVESTRSVGVQTTEINEDQNQDGESSGQMDGMNICKSLGLTNCEFSSRRAVNIYYHLKQHHGMRHRVLSEFASWCRVTSMKDIRTATDNSIRFAGVEVMIKGSPEKFVFVFYTNITKTKDFSVICLHFGRDEASTQELAVVMEVSIANKNARWSWIGKPTHYMKVANAITGPPFKVSIPSLLEKFCEDELLEVIVKGEVQ